MPVRDKSRYPDVLVLCGGLGKRLGPITKNTPKPMVKVAGRPFLDLLLKYLVHSGFRRFILCTGYKSGVIKEYYKKKNPGIEIVFSHERQPLGTGGAVEHARPLIKSDDFMVVNGDTFCRIDFKKFLKFHINKKAIATVVLSVLNGKKDTGFVAMNRKREITGFSEKKPASGARFSNAGIYIFNRRIFSYAKGRRKFSIEYDLFPGLIGKGLYGYAVRERFIDIGTPERYRQAQTGAAALYREV